MANIERFSAAMRENNWDGGLQIGYAQNAYTVFYNEFCDVYNTCFPMKFLNKVIEQTMVIRRDEKFSKN